MEKEYTRRPLTEGCYGNPKSDVRYHVISKRLQLYQNDKMDLFNPPQNFNYRKNES